MGEEYEQTLFKRCTYEAKNHDKKEHIQWSLEKFILKPYEVNISRQLEWQSLKKVWRQLFRGFGEIERLLQSEWEFKFV